MSVQRLQKELKDIKKNPNRYFKVEPTSDLMQWKATILGPEDTPYENHQYHLLITIPQNYPFSAPVVRFAQPCYHPNVSTKGQICLDILKEHKWSPIQNISSILLSIISFLSDPNSSSPLNSDAARIYETDYDQYKILVSKVYLKADKTFKDFPKLTILSDHRVDPHQTSSTSSKLPEVEIVNPVTTTTSPASATSMEFAETISEIPVKLVTPANNQPVTSVNMTAVTSINNQRTSRLVPIRRPIVRKQFF